MKHAERTHALLSASGAHRWLNCPGSALLEQQFPDVSSGAAAEGTLAHELAERKMRNYFHKDYGKRDLARDIKELKKDPVWQDEMLRYTDDYLDYVKGVDLAVKGNVHADIERRVYFSEYTLAGQDDEYEGFGTADCILVYGDTIHVIDFKYGKSPDGRVSAEHNPQMMLYALGAFNLYRLICPVKNIKMSIVQPRLPDGISEWGCTLNDLQAFGEYVKERAALALSGEGEFCPDAKTCKWCRAKASCRARAEKNVAMAFDAGKLPPLISTEEAGRYLSIGEDVAKWLDDLQEWALKECLAGKEVPGWKAVEGRSTRVWTDMDQAFDALARQGIDGTLLYERKPLTLAQVEKMIGKADFQAYVGKYVVKAAGKPTLVKTSDRRPAITNKITAAEAFKEEI